MSFWNLSDGDSAAKDVSTEYKETGFKMIPDKSNVLAEIVGAKWETAYQSTEKFIQLMWAVEKPSEYSGINIQQKLWVTDLDPNAKSREDGIKKRDTARRKLARIDAFGSGKLMASGKSDFTDDDLLLALKGIRGVVFVMKGNTNGNDWNRVVQINPLETEIKIGEDKPSSGPGRNTTPAGAGGGFGDMDDEIPF